MKLVSMTDFVLEQRNIYVEDRITKANVGLHVYLSKTSNYANFLKQPLQLGFFVPCDEDGNVLEEPNSKNYNEETNGWFNACNEYQQAKERVIFDSFYVFDDTLYQNDEMFWVGQFGDTTIEDLTPFNLTITENAIKKYNL